MLVSVVIPVHNAERYIEECLESVLAQSYRPIEIVAVDNNSTDGTAEILQRYAARGVRVVTETRRSAAVARNTGVRAARGDLIAFQDADDVWLPNRLAAQVDFLRDHPDFDIVFGQFANWYPDANGRYPAPESFLGLPESWEVKEPLSGFIYADALLFCPIAMITPVIRRRVFDEVGGFDESLEAGSDYDFWLKTTYRFKAHKIPACMALYRHHGAGITSQARARSTLVFVLERAIKSTGLVGPDGRGVAESDIRRRLATELFHFGILHLQRGSLRIGLSSLGRFFSSSDSKLRATMSFLQMLPSVAKERLRSVNRTMRGNATT